MYFVPGCIPESANRGVLTSSELILTTGWFSRRRYTLYPARSGSVLGLHVISINECCGTAEYTACTAAGTAGGNESWANTLITGESSPSTSPLRESLSRHRVTGLTQYW